MQKIFDCLFGEKDVFCFVFFDGFFARVGVFQFLSQVVVFSLGVG
jgi:hypothetical protein